MTITDGKKILAAFMIAAMCMPANGCSIFRRTRGYNDSDYSVATVYSSDDLNRDTYYVKHDSEYYMPYLGDTTFDSGSSGGSSSGRVAWFGKDIQRIPTMLKGDTVVLRTNRVFEDSLSVERFEDLGYTIGFCGLSQNSQGRFMLNTDTEAMCIDRNSDAGIFYEYPERVYAIESIGDTTLRSGNISRAGTIIGLEEGKKYSLTMYAGSEKINITLAADIKALASSGSTSISGFEYLDDNTVGIKFPDSFNSGYYMVGGYGMVRYINSETDIADADMNIPNVYVSDYDDDDADEDASNTPSPEPLENYTTRMFELEEDSTVSVTVRYDTESGDTAVPSAKVIGLEGAFSLSPEEEGVLHAQMDLPAGEYRLQIYDLNGRMYTYDITDAPDEMP